ncbi:MAG: chloride channel protein [Methanobacterium sp.]|nr:chloride channel protein [Methanobacterium sp.]
MSYDFNLRSKVYWKKMGWGLILGLIGAISALLFVLLMDLGQNIFLYNLNYSWAPFSGPWWIVILMTIIGFIIGLIHRYTPAQQMDVFGSLDKGYLDPKPMPSSVGVSLLSLIGGFSLGPEISTGMLSAGLASWISKKRNLDQDTTKINFLSSISGAWGGLFTSPFAMILILLESKHKQSIIYYGTLLIAGLAAVIGFSIFYAAQGFNYSSLLGILSPPAYHLELWHLGLSIILGIIAVPLALIFVIFNKFFNRMTKPLMSKPIIRSTLGGLLLGLLAVVLPTTIGLGTTSMSIVSQQAVEIGFVLLIIIALAKLVALTGALNFGFIGGPIFPLLFVGSCIGDAIHLLFPQIPLGLALGCMIVAVPAAIVPIPLALSAIGIIVIGLSAANALPVVIAALVAFSVTRGLLMGGKEEIES